LHPATADPPVADDRETTAEHKKAVTSRVGGRRNPPTLIRS
jgi:hypothetical protein